MNYQKEMIDQMKNEDRKFGERVMKTSTAKQHVKREKNRNHFKNMTSSDFAKMSDEYEDEDEDEDQMNY